MRAALVAAAVAFSACSLDLGSGQLRCNHAGGAQCPSGFHCADDDACWRDGEDPVADGGVLPDLTGSTLKSNGQSCGGGGECTSTHCVDGYCCDGACDRPCEVCDKAGSEGRCTPVAAGLPTGARTCLGTASGLCAGTCNGVSADCSYPSTGTRCGAGCAGNCDGQGTCAVDGGVGGCPGNYACGASGCKTTCASGTDCEPNFVCNVAGGVCNRVPENNCFDGNDNNGDTLADCADPTCAPVVSCVASPDPGGALGLFFATLGAANAVCNQGHLGAPQPVYQGILDDGCQGCGCQTVTECAWGLTFFTGTSSCSGGGSAVLDFRLAFPSRCDAVYNMPDTGTAGDTNRSVSIGTMSGGPFVIGCSITSTAPAPKPVRWTTTAYFCPVVNASTAAGCAGNTACAPVAASSYCEDIPAGGACSGRYTHPADVAGNSWYRSSSEGRTCTCPSCSGNTAGTCPSTIPAWTGYQMASCGAPQTATFPTATPGQCIAVGTGAFDWNNTVVSTTSASVAGLGDATCTTTYNKTGTPMPTMPSAICCF